MLISEELPAYDFHPLETSNDPQTQRFQRVLRRDRSEQFLPNRPYQKAHMVANELGYERTRSIEDQSLSSRLLRINMEHEFDRFQSDRAQIPSKNLNLDSPYKQYLRRHFNNTDLESDIGLGTD